MSDTLVKTYTVKVFGSGKIRVSTECDHCNSSSVQETHAPPGSSELIRKGAMRSLDNLMEEHPPEL